MPLHEFPRHEKIAALQRYAQKQQEHLAKLLDVIAEADTLDRWEEVPEAAKETALKHAMAAVDNHLEQAIEPRFLTRIKVSPASFTEAEALLTNHFGIEGRDRMSSTILIAPWAAERASTLLKKNRHRCTID